MARRFVRWLATAGLVGALSTGLVVSSAGTAQADLVWGPAEQRAVKTIAEGFQAGGVRAATPGVWARMQARCLATTVAVLGCSAGAAGLAAGLWIAGETSDQWVPWLVEQASGGDTTGSGGAAGVTNAHIITTSEQLAAAQMNSAGGVSVTVGFTATTNQYYIGIRARCRVLADGSLFESYQFTAWNPGTYTYTQPMCNDGAGRARVFESVAVVAGGVGPDPSTWPEAITWTRPEPAPSGETTSVRQCKRPDGSTYEKVNSSLPVNGYVQVARCDPGDADVSLGVKQQTAPGSGVFGPTTTLDLTPTDGDRSAYPECAGASCVYRILVDGEVCADGVYKCVHWLQIHRVSPSRVECQYGPYVVPTSACYFMERAYSLTADSRVITKENTDGDPDTYTPPAPSPSWNPSAPEATPTPTPTPTPQTTVTASPSPTVTVTAPPATVNCASAYRLGAVQPVTARAVNYLAPLFDIQTVGGVRADIIPDHPSGLAADFMTTDMTVGSQLAEHARVKASELGVQYIIWNQRIWNIDRALEHWRPMADRGSDTANHKDHVHITFRDVVPGTCSADPGDDPEGEGCFARNVGLDPGTWVIGPLKCLFIPQRDISDRTTEITAVVHVKGPGRLFDKVGQLADGFNTGAGCKGPKLPFKLTGIVDLGIYPLDACEGAPLEWPAVYVKALAVVFLTLNGGMSIARAIASAFGMPFSMGRGAEA